MRVYTFLRISLLTSRCGWNKMALLVEEQIYFSRDVHPKYPKREQIQNDRGIDRMIVDFFRVK